MFTLDMHGEEVPCDGAPVKRDERVAFLAKSGWFSGIELQQVCNLVQLSASAQTSKASATVTSTARTMWERSQRSRSDVQSLSKAAGIRSC